LDFAVVDFVVVDFPVFDGPVFALELDVRAGAGVLPLSDCFPSAREGAHKEPQAIPVTIHRTKIREDNTARNLSPEVGAHY
jgi:hypothetical protein